MRRPFGLGANDGSTMQAKCETHWVTFLTFSVLRPGRPIFSGESEDVCPQDTSYHR